jgi:hypothetical protein
MSPAAGAGTPPEGEPTSIKRRITAAVAAVGLTAGAALAVAPAASANTGTNSLAAVLTSDGNQFDRNSFDYDIVTEAVLAVLKEKPGSPVGVLTDGTKAVTAFIPKDYAFRLLVRDLTGQWIFNEQKVFEAVASLGFDTVEQVLLYHVVPGATVDKAGALQSDNAALTTAQGGTFTVDVIAKRFIRLIDNDPDDLNPYVVQFDINKGNAQIAHGISQVLRPLNVEDLL